MAVHRRRVRRQLLVAFEVRQWPHQEPRLRNAQEVARVRERAQRGCLTHFGCLSASANRTDSAAACFTSLAIQNATACLAHRSTAMPDSDADSPMFSRSGISSPLGKFLGELPKQRINLDTLSALQGQAAKADMSLAELVRNILDSHVYGVDTVANMAADRIRQVVRKGAL